MRYDLSAPLALSRIALGAGGWLAPRATLAATLLDPASPQSAYLMRLFAVRDAALGATTLLATDREPLLRLGLVTDAFDAAAGLLAWRNGSVSRRTGIAVSGAAAAAVAAGAWSLRARRRG